MGPAAARIWTSKLTPAAAPALGRAAAVHGAEAAVDWDGDPPPSTGADAGADQHR